MNNAVYIGEFDFFGYTEHRRAFLQRLHGFAPDDDDNSEPTLTNQSGLRQLGVTFRRPK